MHVFVWADTVSLAAETHAVSNSTQQSNHLESIVPNCFKDTYN
jgi:hypothetical protein